MCTPKLKLLALFFAAACFSCGAKTSSDAFDLGPHSTSTSARELGSLAASASLCHLDEPQLIAREVGIQFAAVLWSSPSPEKTLADLAGFTQSQNSFKKEYSGANELEKSQLCTFSWLYWRSMREASTLTLDTSSLETTVDLAQETGGVHGWVWACQNLRGLDGTLIAPIIAHQNAANFALAALTSQSPDDLGKAYRAWSTGFAQGVTDPHLQVEDCSELDKSMPILTKAFESKARIEKELKSARDAYEKLVGPQS